MLTEAVSAVRTLAINMEYMEANKNAIIELVESNHTHKEISKYLSESFPEVKRGFSERNVRLFCANNNVKKMKEGEVDQIVRKCVDEVSCVKFLLIN